MIDFQFVVTLSGFVIIAPRPSRCKHWLLFAIRFFGKPVVVVYVCEFVTFVYDCDFRQNTRMKPETRWKVLELETSDPLHLNGKQVVNINV